MTEYAAIISQTAQEYTRKKDGQIGLTIKATLEDNSGITIYGKSDDRLLLDRKENEYIMVTKNGNFWNISSIINDEGEFVPVKKEFAVNQNPIQSTSTVNNDISQIDTEEVKRYIRWHSKILTYCYEQNPDHGDLLYQQTCQRFTL